MGQRVRRIFFRGREVVRRVILYVQIFIVAYYLKWGKTSWTDYRLDAEYSIIFLTLFCFFGSLGLKCHVSLEYLDRQGGGTNGRIRVIRGGVPKNRKKLTKNKTKM